MHNEKRMGLEGSLSLVVRRILFFAMEKNSCSLIHIDVVQINSF